MGNHYNGGIAHDKISDPKVAGDGDADSAHQEKTTYGQSHYSESYLQMTTDNFGQTGSCKRSEDYQSDSDNNEGFVEVKNPLEEDYVKVKGRKQRSNTFYRLDREDDSYQQDKSPLHSPWVPQQTSGKTYYGEVPCQQVASHPQYTSGNAHSQYLEYASQTNSAYTVGWEPVLTDHNVFQAPNTNAPPMAPAQREAESRFDTGEDGSGSNCSDVQGVVPKNGKRRMQWPYVPPPPWGGA